MEEKPKVRVRKVRKKKEETMSQSQVSNGPRWLEAASWFLIAIAFLVLVFAAVTWMSSVVEPQASETATETAVDQLAGAQVAYTPTPPPALPAAPAEAAPPQDVETTSIDIDININCGTGRCPPEVAFAEVTTPRVTPTPTSLAPTPVAIVPIGADISLARGQLATIPADYTCEGDLRFAPDPANPTKTGFPTYLDDKQETGAASEVWSQVLVYAPWGGNCAPGRELEIHAQGMLAGGCALPNGCTTVHKFVWDGKELRFVGQVPSDP